MRKISQKVYGIIFSLIISFIMSLFMSFFMILINVGFIESFFMAWMGNTAIGLVIGFPIAAIAVPLIRKTLLKYFIVKDL
ncbi:DUF2798 domain-containing protein [uncultured Tenacibaculum sp.]|uniref:DUF2798 domain-containing protein n=1 Tax=uncultured Tenacibaculum sp. TaxID=174713 RepID=UPI002614585C|nr:DUF2798 domain-containing protein [uncultured Tenacibaculum sp.]